ncbi:unnamed protein product [Caenorhabditis sp. 36 PRJEB53466]|nr:unnamed protein product [Caenorhabditis sp. 36 PRJEB53466]
MMSAMEILQTIISYADIGTDEPEDIKPVLPMETFFLAVLLILFYYKLFMTVGCVLFDFLYSTEIQNQFAKTLTNDEDENHQKEFQRHVKKTNCFKKQPLCN